MVLKKAAIFITALVARGSEVNCSDAHPWSNAMTYTDTSKSLVHYEGVEYEAVMWSQNVAPDPKKAKAGSFPWQYIGECEAGTTGEGTYTMLDCSSYSAWDGTKTYAEEGKYSVVFQNKVYKNKYWTASDKPGSSDAWALLGMCKANTAPVGPKGSGLPADFEEKMCACCKGCTSLTVNGPVCMDSVSDENCFFTQCKKYNTFNTAECKAYTDQQVFSYYRGDLKASKGPWPVPVYAPYLDGGLYPFPKLSEIASATGVKYFVLAFLVSPQSSPLVDYGCHAYYASVIPLQQGPVAWNTSTQANDFIYDEVNKLRDMGGDIAVSFGGYNGIEIADSPICANSPEQIAAAYGEVVSYLKLTRIDFDIEGGAYESGKRATGWKSRFDAVKLLSSQHPFLEITWTLPVLPSGLTSDGQLFIHDLLESGTRWDAFNMMNMDYGDNTTCPYTQMGQCGISAVENTARQFYNTAKDLKLDNTYGWTSPADVYPKLASTPMIGQNDVVLEKFTFDDAKMQLKDFSAKKLSWLSNWSLSRDTPCADGHDYTDSLCSTYRDQTKPFEFLNIFKAFNSAY